MGPVAPLSDGNNLARRSAFGQRPARRPARRPSLGRRQQLLVQNGRTETTCHAFWTIRPPKWSLSGHSAKEVAFKRPFCKRSLCPPSSVPSLFGLRPRCRPYRGGRPLPGVPIVRTSHAEDVSQLPSGDSGAFFRQVPYAYLSRHGILQSTEKWLQVFPSKACQVDRLMHSGIFITLQRTRDKRDG